MSRVVVTVGAIPGAGATTLVSTLGSALAEQRSHVALVDASQDGSRIDDVLPLSGGGEVADALRRGSALADVQASGPHDLNAFPAAPDTNWDAIRPGAIANAYDRLRERFDVVLVDCGSELTPASAAWIGYADELVLVNCPEVAGDVGDLTGLASAFDVEILGIVANRVVQDEADETQRVLEATPHQPLAIVPEDPAVDGAATQCQSVLVHEPDSVVAGCVWELARRVRDGDHDDPVVPQSWSAVGASSTTDPAAASTDGGDASVAGDPPADSTSPTATDGSESPTGRSSTTQDGSTAQNESPTRADGAKASDSSGDATSSSERATDDASESGAVDPVATDPDGTVPDDTDPDETVPDEPAPDETGPAATPSADRSSTADDAGGFDWSKPTDDATQSGERSTDQSVEDPATNRGADADDAGAGDDGTAAGSTGAAEDDPEPGADEAAQSTGESERASISDEEIEEAFKETMQRVKENRKASERAGDDEDDSVLGGFMGSNS